MVVFSKRGARGQLSFLRSAGVAFLSTRCVFQSALVIKHYAESIRVPIRLMGRVYHRVILIQTFMLQNGSSFRGACGRIATPIRSNPN